MSQWVNEILAPLTFRRIRQTDNAIRGTVHSSRALFFWLPVILIYVCSVGTGYSQDIVVSAAITPGTLSIDEIATLRVTISGDTQLGKLEIPELEPLSEFIVTYGGTASQYNLSGNQIAVSMTWSYLLKPRRVGQFTLPPVHVPYGGKVYTTQPITVEILPASQKPFQNESTSNAFMDTFSGGEHKVVAFVDNTQPYVNQQITYTFRYLYSTRIPSLDSPKYTLPSFTRFWEKKLAQKPNRREVIDGTLYWIAEIQVALFPITAGRTTIEPAQLFLPASVGLGRNAPTELVTKPVEINVRPFPQVGKPENFAGAVGQYRIEAQVDEQTIEAGNGLSLRLQISGRGNIETLTPPTIPSIPHMTIYDPKITDTIGEADSKIQGSRTYEYVMIPSTDGNWTIPAIEFAYFAPQKESYQIVRTEPIPIHVLPNPQGAVDEPPSTRTQPADMHLRNEDIRYIKPDSIALTDQRLFFYQRPSFWGLQILPAIVVLFAWLYRHQRAKRDLSQLRQGHAEKQAFIAVKEAGKQIESGSAAFFSSLAAALYQYVGNIFDISPTGLTPERVRQGCEAAGISESVTKRLVDVLTQCDYMRFAPVSATLAEMENVLNQAQTAIGEIEKERG